MFFNFEDKTLRRDTWFRAMMKSNSSNELATLIRNRIEDPRVYGPYLKAYEGELSTDIINAIIANDDVVKKQATPAVCLLLFRIVKNEIEERHPLLRGLFAIIEESKIEAAHYLLDEWLKVKYTSILKSSSTHEDKITYRDAMMAFARIQKKDEVIELQWFNMWREGSDFWWATAFTGLRQQNPKSACSELPLLMERKIDTTPYILYAMWSDKASRALIERTIKKGLKENADWAGVAMHILLDKLNSDQKIEFMSNTKAV
jgi:hypothetical protein